MKKIYHLILFLIALGMLYIGSVLAFPSTMEKFGEKFGFSELNTSILSMMGRVNDVTTNLDAKETYDKQMKKATQIKQKTQENIKKVQDGIQEVKDTVETIQTQGKQTIDAVNEAYDAGKKAVEEVNKFQETVKDAVPKKKKNTEDDENNSWQ